MSRAPILFLAAVIAAVFIGSCSRPAVEPQLAEGAFFPHAEGYDETSRHGLDYLGVDGVACQECHVLESTDEAAAAGCRSCHASFPHVTDWSLAENHGAAWRDAADPAECTGCHGADLAGGPSESACDTCHTSWPHPESWEEGAVHGAYLASRQSLDACLGCHEAEASAPEPDPRGCKDCHARYPHDAGWQAGSAHGAAWLDTSDCGTCHGEAGDGGAWGPGCTSCHGVYPHEAEWVVGHRVEVEATGEGACLLCHEAGDGPVTFPVTCAATCHGPAE